VHHIIHIPLSRTLASCVKNFDMRAVGFAGSFDTGPEGLALEGEQAYWEFIETHTEEGSPQARVTMEVVVTVQSRPLVYALKIFLILCLPVGLLIPAPRGLCQRRGASFGSSWAIQEGFLVFTMFYPCLVSDASPLPSLSRFQTQIRISRSRKPGRCV